MNMLSSVPAIILCGGKGSRMGALTKAVPKPLVSIQGKPILWYTILTLFQHGFRTFVFPLGYHGQQIKDFCRNHLSFLDAEFQFYDTGVDTSIPGRMLILKESFFDTFYPNGNDFFLCNGDTVFDFDLTEMYERHRLSSSLLTLASTEIHSQYGLILEKDGNIVDFARDLSIHHMSPSNKAGESAYIYSGICYINSSVLDHDKLTNSTNFEHDLYPAIVASGRSTHYQLDGYWYAVDTPKDLDILNSTVRDSRINMKEVVRAVKNSLASRYSYKSRYISNIEDFKESVINKTVIPHQVEVQPGPIGQKNLCWLKCPYCYGGSAIDSGERLPIERYKQILHQIADGGVKKIIFAGYTTDPLNYKYIEQLSQIPLERKQIFGFHTKAINVSDQLADLISSPDAQPMSYFSVSVDAGSDKTYNIVHGVQGSQAKLFTRVLDNLEKIANKRSSTGSTRLDISATYLINNFNCSVEEISNAILSLRNCGVDIVRFTFPQIPKGYKHNPEDQFIPDRPRTEQIYSDVSELIAGMSTESCQTLIMDLDADYEIEEVTRTLPCYARFVFPSIGFDGWLGHCSESSSPHFRDISLGDLKENDFWDLFYNYDPERMANMLSDSSKNMATLGCRCDRKEHVVNACLKELHW